MPIAETSLMFREAGSAGTSLLRQFSNMEESLAAIASDFAARPPSFVVTCARGSSDHAGLYGKYLFETQLGLPVVSFAPSVASIYQSSMALEGALFICISQSGQSADLIMSAKIAAQSGARVIAIVNDVTSPLAEAADFVLPISAGPEQSVAATKSYISSLTALASLVFRLAEDSDGADAMLSLPDQLESAWRLDWSECLPCFSDASSLFVVGRGAGLAVAEEAALKFKETCALHAEAFSAAEVKHGPMTIVRDGFPVLFFVPSDQAADGYEELAQSFSERGAKCFAVGEELPGAANLPAMSVSTVPALTPILQIQSFYRMVNALSFQRGLNPDTPPFLNKVTVTR